MWHDRTKMLARLKAKRPSRKSVQAALAAQSPDGWVAPAREKVRRERVVREPLPDMARDVPDED